MIELDKSKQLAIASIVDQVQASCNISMQSDVNPDPGKQLSSQDQSLQRDSLIDNQLKQELQMKFKNPSYQTLLVSNFINSTVIIRSSTVNRCTYLAIVSCI